MSVGASLLVCFGVAVVCEIARFIGSRRAWKAAFAGWRCRQHGHNWQFDVPSQAYTGVCVDCMLFDPGIKGTAVLPGET